MTKPHVKLFIPGPVEVSEDTFDAMCQPMIGHRGTGFSGPVRCDPAQTTADPLHEKPRFHFHIVGVGSDGSIGSQSRRKEGAELLLRGVLR